MLSRGAGPTGFFSAGAALRWVLHFDSLNVSGWSCVCLFSLLMLPSKSPSLVAGGFVGDESK